MEVNAHPLAPDTYHCLFNGLTPRCRVFIRVPPRVQQIVCVKTSVGQRGTHLAGCAPPNTIIQIYHRTDARANPDLIQSRIQSYHILLLPRDIEINIHRKMRRNKAKRERDTESATLSPRARKVRTNARAARNRAGRIKSPIKGERKLSGENNCTRVILVPFSRIMRRRIIKFEARPGANAPMPATWIASSFCRARGHAAERAGGEKSSCIGRMEGTTSVDKRQSETGRGRGRRTRRRRRRRKGGGG